MSIVNDKNKLLVALAVLGAFGFAKRFLDTQKPQHLRMAGNRPIGPVRASPIDEVKKEFDALMWRQYELLKKNHEAVAMENRMLKDENLKLQMQVAELKDQWPWPFRWIQVFTREAKG